MIASLKCENHGLGCTLHVVATKHKPTLLWCSKENILNLRHLLAHMKFVRKQRDWLMIDAWGVVCRPESTINLGISQTSAIMHGSCASPNQQRLELGSSKRDYWQIESKSYSYQATGIKCPCWLTHQQIYLVILFTPKWKGNKRGCCPSIYGPITIFVFILTASRKTGAVTHVVAEVLSRLSGCVTGSIIASGMEVLSST